MPQLRFHIVNVFAESTFGGNPLCVVEAAEGLPDRDMQLIARQFNLSETVFLFRSERAAARLRIFTPSYEMPFAGHPTLGAAQVVRRRFAVGDAFELELAVGPIAVRATANRWTLTAKPPSYRPLPASVAELECLLGLPAGAVLQPAMWVSCGSEQALIPLSSVEQVHACRPDPLLLARHCSNASGQAKCYVFARTAEGFESRFFWLSGANGLQEDPGTGSACANLGGWWLATQGDRPLTARIDQARSIDRHNVLQLQVNDGNIQVGGQVIELGTGELQW